jgi:fatty-acyl-CoA synthase
VSVLTQLLPWVESTGNWSAQMLAAFAAQPGRSCCMDLSNRNLNLNTIRVTCDNRGVVTAAFDLPGRSYNVLSSEVFADLQELVTYLENDPVARIVIFRGGKETGFLAGADLREIAAMQTPEDAEQLVVTGQEVFNRLEGLAIPTIAAIHGPCLGGGLEFAMACRYRIARDDDSTRLGLPETRLGLIPAWAGVRRLSELVGLEAALPMLLTGRKVSARQALEMGLVDAVWPAETWDEGVEQFVAARLEGELPRRRGGSQSEPDTLTCLQSARRRLALRGRHGPALAAILSGIEEGLGGTGEPAWERTAFPELLFGDFGRRRLARFFRRSRPRPRPPWVEGLTIGAMLRETARRFPDHDALIFPQAGVRLTWAEFDRAVDRVARGLLAIRLGRGDRFGVWSTNWPQWVLLQFAAARAGVILVTINPAFRSSELQYTLAQSEVRGLALIERYRSSAYFDILREVCPEVDTAPPGQIQSARFPYLRWVVRINGREQAGMLAWEDLEAAGETIPPERLEEAGRHLLPTDPINLQYTSGTTGAPKGALLSHRNLLLNAFYAAGRQRLEASDRICIPVPLYHCFGCVLGTMCAAVSGAAMVFPNESFDAEATLRAIEAERCTAIYGVPTMFIAELEHPTFRQRDLSSLRTGIMAGSPCPIEIMRRVADEMGAREITIAYGQTEASPLITMTQTDDPIEKRVGTVGRPFPGIEVRIVDPVSGAILGDECSGELCCRGHDVMLGYYNMPEATAKAIDAEGWLHTGDLALRQPGGYFRITGRIKEMIIRGGENIAPREIEELLYQHPKVEQVAVVGVPDPKFGEEVLASIKLRAGETSTVDEIRDYCRARMAHFKSPRYVRFVDSFPTTVTGKVQKFKIREQAIEELGLHVAAAIETA